MDLSGAVTNPSGILRIDTTAPTAAITAPIAGDNTVSAGEAAAGFTIGGTTVGVEAGQTATVTIVDSTNAVVQSFTRINRAGLFGEKGTKAFARSPDWRTEADRILASVTTKNSKPEK